MRAGDSLSIPADTVHWCPNPGDERGTFLRAVPDGDDGIVLVDSDDGSAGRA